MKAKILVLPISKPVNSDKDKESVSDEIYYIIPDKCKGF
jgi:hypothetical protein